MFLLFNKILHSDKIYTYEKLDKIHLSSKYVGIHFKCS